MVSKKNTICFFNQYRIWGGGEKWHYTAAAYMSDHGQAVVVFTPKNGELFKKALGHGAIKCQHVTVNKYSYFNPVSILSYIYKFKKHNVETVVFNSQTDVRSAAIAARLAGVRKIIYRAGIPSVIPNKRSYIWAFNSLTRLVPISKAIGTQFVQESPHVVTKVKMDVIIPNAVDFEVYDKQTYSLLYDNKDGEVVLGNSARLCSQKAQHYLIEMAKILNEQGVNFKLLIAGSGELEGELKEMVRRYQLEQRVVFLGFVDNIKSFLKSLDIYVFSSLFEGTASSLVEAMAFELPIVCFDVSSMPEVVSNNETGFLVECDNYRDFAAKVKMLIDDKELRIRLGKEGRRQAEMKFNIKINYQRWFDLLVEEA